MPAIPTILFLGNPEYFCKAITITSNGLVIHITKALGDVFLIPSATCLIILRLIPTATHTQEDIDETITAFSAIREKLENGTYKKIGAVL